MFEGMVEEGLEIVLICRTRYDGKIRNPFLAIKSGSIKITKCLVSCMEMKIKITG